MNCAGKVVRIGPNSLVFLEPEAVQGNSQVQMNLLHS